MEPVTLQTDHMETYEKVALSVLVAVVGFCLVVWFGLIVLEHVDPSGMIIELGSD